MTGWRVSGHARRRAAEMGVTLGELVAVAEHPVTDYPCTTVRYAGRRIALRDGIGVVYEPLQRAIITVIWDDPLGGRRAC